MTRAWVDGEEIMACWSEVVGRWQLRGIARIEWADSTVKYIRDYTHVSHLLTQLDLADQEPTGNARNGLHKHKRRKETAMRNPASTVFVQYTIKGDKIAEQESAIRECAGSIQALNDPKVEYSVYKTEEGASFVHHIQMANGEVCSRLQALPLFGPFGAGTKERSENGLTVTKLSRLASSPRG